MTKRNDYGRKRNKLMTNCQFFVCQRFEMHGRNQFF